MAAVVFPRRTTSTGTNVTVQAIASPLSVAAAALGGNQFVTFSESTFWTRTKDLREPNVTNNENDPCQDFRWTSPTEQGDTGHGLSYTLWDWGGKIPWDSIGRQIMCAANGANPGGGSIATYSWKYSKYSVYHENANGNYFGQNVPANSWTQERGVKGFNEGAEPDCIVHQLGNNCIDIVGRRFFKKKFRDASFYWRNLTTGVWTWVQIQNQGSSNREAESNRSGGMDFIPTRGVSGMLWVFGQNHSTGQLQLTEMDPVTGAWTLIQPSSAFGSAVPTNAGFTCVYNPRAFGGAGGVLVGGADGLSHKVRCSDLVVFSAGTPTVALQAGTGHRVVPSPIGDGWFHFVSGSPGIIYHTPGNAATSSWSSVATMPTLCDTAQNRMPCSIDTYGVVLISCSYLSSGQNGHQNWLWRPTI